MSTEYELCEPFDIDHGELHGLNRQTVFVLGVEWQMVYQGLENGRDYARMIHSENIARVRNMCQRRGRTFEITPFNDDWAQLVVEAM
jgi:hypothetical protein